MQPKTRRILIVDDEVDYCQNLLDIFSDQGDDACLALDGPAALTLLEEQEFDITLIDFKMPGANGLEIYSQMQQLRPSMPVILISAYLDGPASEKAKSSSIKTILSKPVDVGQLLQLIDQLCQ